MGIVSTVPQSVVAGPQAMTIQFIAYDISHELYAPVRVKYQPRRGASAIWETTQKGTDLAVKQA